MGQDAVAITVSDWMAAQTRTKRYLSVLTLVRQPRPARWVAGS